MFEVAVFKHFQYCVLGDSKETTVSLLRTTSVVQNTVIYILFQEVPELLKLYFWIHPLDKSITMGGICRNCGLREGSGWGARTSQKSHWPPLTGKQLYSMTEKEVPFPNSSAQRRYSFVFLKKMC
jgi:hypothetical protein